MSSLFRDSALAAQQTPWLGEVILARPPSFRVWGAGAALVTATILGFLAFGSYTRRTTVAGQLVPDLGLIKVYSPESGTIVEKFVIDNQPVRRNQALFVITGERRSSSLGQEQASISLAVRERQESLREEIRTLDRLEREERASLREKIAELRTEVATLQEASAQQRARTSLATVIEQRYRALRAHDYVSDDQLDAKRADRLEQQTTLDSLVRQLADARQQLSEKTSSLEQLPLRYAQQRAEKQQAIDSAEQELQESEARRMIVVAAPADGTATAVTGSVGQESDPEKPLVSIVPAHSHLIAQFYVPPRAIGFIRSGQRVQLRYEAYPYEKFGHYPGTVAFVSRVALTSVELTGTNLFATAGDDKATQPLYRVTVSLASQDVRAFGRLIPLQPGMLVNADILQDRRRLYEWVLEPLYTVTGKL